MKTTLTVLLIINLYGLASCAIKHHYYINLKKTWNDALNHCRTYYHDLSTFTDATEEQQFLQDAVNQTSSAWIGLNKTSGIWKWAGGEVAKRISWEYGQPDNDNCVFLHHVSEKLHDATCSYQFSCFCMRFDFFMVQQSESWEGALDYCRDHYDDLATLTSVNSKEYALSQITNAQTEYVWIGLRFLAGEWSWVSGYDVLPLLLNGQPQCPAQNQRCGALQKNTQIWTPKDCEEKFNFLCL